MGNEMGNNNTSGLKDEENTTTVEASKTSLVDTSYANDSKEEHQSVPEVEGTDIDKKVTNLTSDDPETKAVPCVQNQTSCITEQEDIEVHHRAKSPKDATESTEARERVSTMDSDTSLSDSVQEKVTETDIEETDLQGTLLNQLEKEDSIRKEDEEDGTTSTSQKLEPEANNRIEACHMHMPDSTPEDDTTGENQLVAEVEGSEIHEYVANLTSDHQNKIEDPCVENQSSTLNEHEDNKVHPLGESPEVWEEDIKIQPGTLLSDSVHEEIMEHKEETDIQGPMQYQLQKQDSFKKEDEEDGTASISHEIEAKDSKHFASNLHELATVQAQQSVKDGIGSLLGNKDCLGSNLTSDCESRGHFIDTETLKNIEGSSDSSTGSALEKQGAAMSLEHNTSEERLKSSEEFETEDGEEVENGLSKTLIASDDLLVLENECKIPTERNLFVSPKVEPEALLVSNFDLEVPEHEVKCLIIQDDIGITRKGLENGEEIYASSQIQPCLVSGMESEPDCVKSSELTDEESEKVNVINPSTNKDCQVEEAKVVEDGNQVVMCLNNQGEASESKCYQESEMKVEEVPKVEIISTASTILDLHHKEEELVAIEMEEADTTQQDSSSSLESTTLGHDFVQRDNDSSPQLKQENSGELFATQASIIIDCTSWISEALVSMNKLEAEILGQQITQQNEAAQVETAAEINIAAEVETSSASVSSSSETQESVGRSSTVSIESNPGNVNIVHGQIQKSPSFNLDLQNVAITEESDSTPLLYQDKAEIKSSPSQVEKVITLERSESEESRTPFLGFMKDQEENHVVEKIKKHQKHSEENSTKNVADSVTRKATTTSSKGKEKRRLRSSLFSNCLCCASMNN